MTKTRVCDECSKRKKLDQFGENKRRGRAAIPHKKCRTCRNAYKREWMAASAARRERNATAGKRSRKKLIEEIDAIKAEATCADCGYDWEPWQMQFDHVRGAKEGNVSDYARRGARHKAYSEIKKCELVCANCHADRTHRRRVAQEESASVTS